MKTSSAPGMFRFPQPAQSDDSGGVRSIGFFWTVIALLPWYCFVFDAYLAPLHLPMVSLIAGMITAIASGSLLRTATEMPGRGYIFLTCWMVLGVPFAVWKGGAVMAMKDIWIVAVVTFFVVASNIDSVWKVRLAVSALAVGIGITMFGAVFKGTLFYGRLGIDGTRFGDSNDLALVCVMGLPLIGFVCLNRVFFPVRLFAMAAIPAALYTFLKTGSRGGFLGLAVVALLLFKRTSLQNKIKLAAVAVVIIIGARFVVSPEVLGRFMLLSTSANETVLADNELAGGATDSARARKELLKQSLIITARHPIFGVGMNNFAVAENAAAIADGKLRGSWHVTHNMYTQWSSEAGIPAALMIIAMIISCWKMLTRVERCQFPSLQPDEQRYVSNLAFAFKASLLGYSVSGLFLGVAYVGQLPVLLALIAQFSKTYLRVAEPQPSPTRPAVQVASHLRQPSLIPSR